MQITLDVGYYALGSLNLSKSCVSCTFEFLISVTPYLQTHHLRGIPRGHGSKTPTHTLVFKALDLKVLYKIMF
jgi:hypothetical protein